jgi:outer membrane protein
VHTCPHVELPRVLKKLEGHLPKSLRINLAVIAAALFAVSSAAVFTQSRVSAAPVPARIAIANIQEAIASTEDGKREIDALQKRFAPKQAALKQLNAEVEGIKRRLADSKTTEADRKTLAKDVEAKQKKLERDYNDAQAEMQQAESDAVGRIGNKMLGVLKTYSEKNDFAVVLDVSSPQTPVLYASPVINITKDLIAAYNAANLQPQKPALPSAPTPQERK